MHQSVMACNLLNITLEANLGGNLIMKRRRNYKVILGCMALGTIAGLCTGGVGIALMGTAFGVSGPLAGATIGAGAGLILR